MREKAKIDPSFREYLLNYIISIINECISEDSISYEDENFEEYNGDKIFHSFISIDDSKFDKLIQTHIAYLISSRQIYNRIHISTCFKYGSKTCHSRFPHAIIEKIIFDIEIDVIMVKRDHCWVNNYNK